MGGGCGDSPVFGLGGCGDSPLYGYGGCGDSLLYDNDEYGNLPFEVDFSHGDESVDHYSNQLPDIRYHTRTTRL